MIEGIIVRTFHVECGDEEEVVSIPDGTIIEGSIRSAKLRLVQAWIEIHQDDLMADWRPAISGQAVFKIEALK